MDGNYLKFIVLISCLFMASCATKQIVPDEQVENYGKHDFGEIDLIETDTVE